MAKTPEQLDELLKLVRDEDIATLRALERELHSLLEQKERDEARKRRSENARDLLSQCPNVAIDPDLLGLVGIHPENPVKDDKALIRETVARRLTD
jgi:FKBP-type peptidyl-prolyl cis-trans isomerase (trigger factor)